MADSAKVVGDELIVSHNGGTVRLSLAVPAEGFDRWLEFDTAMPWRELHEAVRDQVMPASAREQIVAAEQSDALWAIALVRRWVWALNERLGKSLSLSLFGEESEPLSQPTSGSDTGSAPTESEPTAPEKSPRSTRKRS